MLCKASQRKKSLSDNNGGFACSFETNDALSWALIALLLTLPYNRWIRSTGELRCSRQQRSRAKQPGNPTTTRFGRLNARKKHNLPYIETIHIQLGRCWSAGLRPRRERFIIVPWKMLKSFLKKRMLNPLGCWRFTSIVQLTSTKELWILKSFFKSDPLAGEGRTAGRPRK